MKENNKEIKIDYRLRAIFKLEKNPIAITHHAEDRTNEPF